ncbi:T3SS (YopN, CesT) and YbjN peptide-binding chaperone 1 [Speluncibacter jeojiensis]|uniref:TY-Chap central domain-containing protein n=1 Tax=Speluncibacter jeojiensis TaxID=2710754 RepID=A0A9X4RE52_9ACTN|nr:hypothetical protein [Corynebacteriales bacterium D3-21]
MTDQADLPLQLDDAFAVATEDRDELRSYCLRALTELFGAEPDLDEDGDIVVPVHGFALYVTVAEDGPQLHVWSSLLDGVTDRARAAGPLLDLSEEWPRLRFTLDREHLLVSTLLDADPFAPQHLLNLVEEIHELTHDLDDDFAARFGAALDCDADDDSYAGDCNPGGCDCGDCDCAGDGLGETIPVGAPQD